MDIEYYVFRKDNGKPDFMANLKYRAGRKLELLLYR